MINFSTVTTRLHKLAHAGWSGPSHALLAEMQQLKDHVYETIDPLFRAESRFAEKVNDWKRDRIEEHRDDTD